MKRREEFAVDERVRLDIEVRSGDVSVRTGAVGQAVVEVNGDGADDYEISQLGDSIVVRPTGRWTLRSRSVQVSAQVPRRADVDVTSGSADVMLNGELGACRIRTASGDARVDASSRLDVSTASGDVRVGSASVDLMCATASGDVDVDTASAQVSVTTASGDVRAASLSGGVHIGTASGSVRIDRYEGNDLSVKCVSGDITVGLPSGIRVEPDIATMSGRTRLPQPAAGVQPAQRRRVRLRLRTVSGDIVIDRVG
jgi:DUF4097 and DUF4098 domain-containing protein YvlB